MRGERGRLRAYARLFMILNKKHSFEILHIAYLAFSSDVLSPSYL